MSKNNQEVTTGNTNTQNIDVIATKLDYISGDVASLRDDVKEIKTKLESNYATKEWCDAQFGQTKRLVNGILVTFGTTIIVAISAFIIRGGLQ